jgi:hypothetical protein
MQFRGFEQYVLATLAALASPISVATHFTQQNGIMGIVTGVDLAGAERLSTSSKALRCRRKFLGIFRSGFRDETYLEWERNYKWEAHRQWQTQLDRAPFQSLLRNNEYAEIAARSVRIESRTNLLFRAGETYFLETECDAGGGGELRIRFSVCVQAVMVQVCQPTGVR